MSHLSVPAELKYEAGIPWGSQWQYLWNIGTPKGILTLFSSHHPLSLFLSSYLSLGHQRPCIFEMLASVSNLPLPEYRHLRCHCRDSWDIYTLSPTRPQSITQLTEDKDGLNPSIAHDLQHVAGERYTSKYLRKRYRKWLLKSNLLCWAWEHKSINMGPCCGVSQDGCMDLLLKSSQAVNVLAKAGAWCATQMLCSPH